MTRLLALLLLVGACQREAPNRTAAEYCRTPGTFRYDGEAHGMRFMRLVASVLLVIAWAAAVPSPARADDDHACGKGRVFIHLSLGSCCACPQPEPLPQRIAGDTYARPSITEVYAICCGCGTYDELWTDWPECGGKRVESAPIDVKEGNVIYLRPWAPRCTAHPQRCETDS